MRPATVALPAATRCETADHEIQPSPSGSRRGTVSGGVLARFASRAEAECYIIDRELEAARRAAERVLA